MENSGIIDVGQDLSELDGYKFIWIRSGKGHPEIWGVLQAPDGYNIKGTDGWYRTADVGEAMAASITAMLG